MALDRKNTHAKLTRLFKNSTIKTIPHAGQKFAIISDIHLGNGGGADDFRDNEKILSRALDHYFKKDFTLILLGDIEEFWQFDLGDICMRYDKSIYSRMRKFGDDRIIRLYGNHDSEWGSADDPATPKPVRSAVAAEALKLTDETGQNIDFFLVHGHQGSVESDKNSWISRVAVRLFRGIEPVAAGLGLYGHGLSTKSQIRKDYERIMYSWARKNNTVIICGHTHRAIFASRSHIERLHDRVDFLEAGIAAGGLTEKEIKRDKMTIRITKNFIKEEEAKDRDIDPLDLDGEPGPNYFNTGCGLYPDGLTMLEIDNGLIRLVKWDTKKTDLARRIVYESRKVTEIIAEATGRG